MRLRAALAVAGLLALTLTGCNTSPKPAPQVTQSQAPDNAAPEVSESPFTAPPAKPNPPKKLTVKSSAFADGKPLKQLIE